MDYDVIVIGGGPGGYVSAIRSAQLGHKTAVIEKDSMGGICLNWGCIPTKALLKNAEVYKMILEADKFGIKVDNPSYDWKKIINRSRKIAKRLSKGIEYLMKKNNILIIVLCFMISCSENKNQSPNFSILIHGGAGTMEREKMSIEKELEYKKKLEEALNKGYEILENNGSSELAVIEAIKVMEDSPLFNAGKGAVLDERGEASLDASFMSGKNLNAGAVAGVKKIKNPITAAYSVMKNTPQVFLISEGADQFAKEQGLNLVDNSYFITERRKAQLLKNKNPVQLKDKKDLSSSISKFGTVGCVALDKNGNLSAGTSTGGRSNKKWGRVGDVPIIGAGNYANNNTCAISATGWGEFFIRNVVAHDISSLLEYKNLDIGEATKISLEKVKKLGGSGGVIALDKFGNYAMEFNTKGMYRGIRDSKGNFQVLIFKND